MRTEVLGSLRLGQRGQKLLAPEHALDLRGALAGVERVDASVRRVAGDLLDHEVTRGSAGDLGQGA